MAGICFTVATGRVQHLWKEEGRMYKPILVTPLGGYSNFSTRGGGGGKRRRKRGRRRGNEGRKREESGETRRRDKKETEEGRKGEKRGEINHVKLKTQAQINLSLLPLSVT
jgi:hypothetical protein